MAVIAMSMLAFAVTVVVRTMVIVMLERIGVGAVMFHSRLSSNPPDVCAVHRMSARRVA
jgi:hypothetical protein